MPELVTIVSIIGVLVALLLPGGDLDFNHRFPPPDPTPGNRFADVAGEYVQGLCRGKHWSLRILPDGRYSFIWSGCCGVYNRESGSVGRISGYLILCLVKPIRPRMARIFLPIKAGGASYLVPPEQCASFHDAIKRGIEPRSQAPGDFYLLNLDATPSTRSSWVSGGFKTARSPAANEAGRR